MAFLLTQLAEYTISFERLSPVIIGPLSDYLPDPIPLIFRRSKQ